MATKALENRAVGERETWKRYIKSGISSIYIMSPRLPDLKLLELRWVYKCILSTSLQLLRKFIAPCECQVNSRFHSYFLSISGCLSRILV